ncbi:hypothetical protein TEA_005283 [Camellia sinensis var. sinensis]|uniref:Patatin n=1 Tax=Camellia sinensis var. sinensis TaxID=542762 RepID=A0A4S4DTT4_CAMSN|nr:hypothetical protein TEA_005283 [Camellia sinensis var. sinensis]
MKRYNMHSDNPQDQATSSASPMASLSSLFLSNPRSLRLPNPNPNPNPQIHLPLRSQTLTFSSNSSQISTDSPPPPPPPPEKKSFAVATGELFLGIATRIIKRRNGIDGGDSNSVPITMFRDSERESYFWRRTKEGIASVVEDPVQPEVVWEQRLKDVEAERCRKAVTSPGFSFSAAGLLFPYHLGVAQFLIEKGYIKDTTPLAGSSAGAIVCAVIASGASMEEALKATKILAEDCRLRGTAFRLGAVLKDVLDKFLPDDVHFRSNGRVRVAVTQILWRPRGLLVDQFDSKEDLINAVFTSSFIPGAEPIGFRLTLVGRPFHQQHSRVRSLPGWIISQPSSSVDLLSSSSSVDFLTSSISSPSSVNRHSAVSSSAWRSPPAISSLVFFVTCLPQPLISLWLDKELPDSYNKLKSHEARVRVLIQVLVWYRYVAPRPATMFRNRLCIDGGLTLFMPPTSATQTIRVCAFPASRLGLQGIGISPDCNPESRATPRELFNWALEPAEDDILDKLFEYGYLDAAVWAEENPVEEIVRDDHPHVENSAVA